MSDEDLRPWIRSSSSISKVTAAALADALEGFKLAPDGGMDLLAREIQGALLFIFPFLAELRHPETGEQCVINVPNATEAKRAYSDLSKAANELLVTLIRNSDLVAYRLATPERYDEIHNQIEQIAKLFSDASTNAKPAKPRWRQARARQDRIQIALALSPVFEKAFKRKPAVDNWPDSDGGPWPDFFQRIMALTLDEWNTPDRLGVLEEARSMILLNRGTLAPE